MSERFARSVFHTVAARVALTRQDWASAVKHGSAARGELTEYPPFGLMASAHWTTALSRQGATDEAAVIARRDSRWLETLGSPICSEVLFQVAAAQALHASGDAAAAGETLRKALKQIELRAATLLDAGLRSSYLTRREENRQARELARQWAIS